MFDINRVTLDWGGRKLVLETGKVARQADGAEPDAAPGPVPAALLAALDPLRRPGAAAR